MRYKNVGTIFFRFVNAFTRLTYRRTDIWLMLYCALHCMQSRGKNVAVRSARNTVKVHLIEVTRTKWKKSGHNDNNIEWSSDYNFD